MRGQPLVTVSRGPSRPYRYQGTGWLRVGAATTQLSEEQCQLIAVEQRHGNQRWELEASRHSIDDLNIDELHVTITEAVRLGRLRDPNTREPADLLRGLGLMTDHCAITNAATALFGQADRLMPHYTQYLLRVARFNGTEKTDPMTAEAQRHLPAFDLLAHAEQFCLDHLRVAAHLPAGSTRRIDQPEIPPEATREALANAIAHRDYATGAGSITVAVFDDRVEVTSIGPLHFGLTVEALHQPHGSQSWNPTIAHTLYLRGIIETWGTGIQRMTDTTRNAGLLEPDITAAANSVTVTFTRPGQLPRWLSALDLDDTDRAILQAIARHTPAPSTLIAEATGQPLRTVQSRLDRLRTDGHVALTGQTRTARWALRPRRA